MGMGHGMNWRDNGRDRPGAKLRRQRVVGAHWAAWARPPRPKPIKVLTIEEVLERLRARGAER